MGNSFSVQASSVPVGYEEITHYAPIRLGAGGLLAVHDVTNHCSKGITGISIDDQGYLNVHQEWAEGEMIGYACASVDLQLASRGVTAGVSGGAAISKVGIYRPATTKIGVMVRMRPDDDWFTTYDNLWYYAVSLRPIGAVVNPTG
jgi:hypothetical protein